MKPRPVTHVIKCYVGLRRFQVDVKVSPALLSYENVIIKVMRVYFSSNFEQKLPRTPQGFPIKKQSYLAKK